MNIAIPRPWEGFIRQLIESGRYHNASEVVRAALRKLQETVAKHDKRVQSLSRAVGRQTENQKRLAREESSLLATLEKHTHDTA